MPLFPLQIAIRTNPLLAQVPAWIAANATATLLTQVTSDCSGLPSVIITSAADYTNYINSAQLGATQLGMFVVTWVNITDAQLAVALSNKTALAGLALDGLSFVTTVNLDSLTSDVTSGLAFESMPQLTSISLASVSSVSGGFRISTNTRLITVSAPNVTTVVGDLYIFNNAAATTMDFSSLVNVSGILTLRSLNFLSGAAVSNGFASLQTVGAQLMLYTLSVSGADLRTALVLPALQSVGSLYVHTVYVSRLSLPVLETVGAPGYNGLMYIFNLIYLRALEMPSLQLVSGLITFQNLNILTNLCEIGLPSSGYIWTAPVRCRPFSLSVTFFLHLQLTITDTTTACVAAH